MFIGVKDFEKLVKHNWTGKVQSLYFFFSFGTFLTDFIIFFVEMFWYTNTNLWFNYDELQLTVQSIVQVLSRNNDKTEKLLVFTPA